MTHATKKMVEQAKYITLLAKKIEDAVGRLPDNVIQPSRASGTINNLAPELSKAASQIKQMNAYGWK